MRTMRCGATLAALAMLGVASVASAACPGAKDPDCRNSVKKLLLIKNKTADAKDKLIWKFIKGGLTTPEEFADPTTTATYNLCIYAGTTDTLVADLEVGPDAVKWQTVGTKGYKYKDQAAGTPSGVTKVLVKSGPPFTTKALLKAKGTNLPDPLDSSPLGTNVTVQLFNSDTPAVCWQTSFSAPTKDTDALYKAKQ